MTEWAIEFGRFFVITSYLPGVAFLLLVRLLIVPTLPSSWQTALEKVAGSGLGSDIVFYALAPLILGSLLASVSSQILWLYTGDYWPFRRRRRIADGQPSVSDEGGGDDYGDLASWLGEIQDELAVTADPEKARELQGYVEGIQQEMRAASGSPWNIRPSSLKPTRMGNVLAAIEEYPERRYGMVSPLLWPRLLGILPTKLDGLIKAQNTSVMFLLNLSLLSLVFAGLWVLLGIGILLNWVQVAGVLWWGALVVALASSYLLYRLAVSAARPMADSIMSAYDLCRVDLSEQLHLELPKTLASEAVMWRRLGYFIALGDGRFHPTASGVKFLEPEPKEESASGLLKVFRALLGRSKR